MHGGEEGVIERHQFRGCRSLPKLSRGATKCASSSRPRLSATVSMARCSIISVGSPLNTADVLVIEGYDFFPLHEHAPTVPCPVPGLELREFDRWSLMTTVIAMRDLKLAPPSTVRGKCHASDAPSTVNVAEATRPHAKSKQCLSTITCTMHPVAKIGSPTVCVSSTTGPKQR